MADDFKETEASERYANALFELGEDQGATDAIRADLLALKAMRAESRDLRELLASPAYSAEQKFAGLKALAAAAGFNATTVKFLGLLAANRRSRELPAVITGFLRLYDRRRGVVAAEVTSAIKLTAKQLDGVRATLAQQLGREPEITAVVDPAILGGLKVKVGSRLFDSSLKTKLDHLKFALQRA